MRKWMRDRAKRRNKSPNEQGGEAATPLQPAYFDAEMPPQERTSQEHREETGPSPAEVFATPERGSHLDTAGADAESGADAEAQNRPSEGPADGVRRKRRRRGKPAAKRPPRQSQAVAQEPAGGGAELESAGDGQEPEASAATELSGSAAAQAETPAPSAAPGAARPSKGIVVLAIGLPGSGKSSWFKRHDIRPLSSDLLRELLFDNAQEQRFQDLIFSNLRSMLKARLIARRPMNYVDATNLTSHDRQSWIKLAKDYGYEVQAVFFDVPAEVCLERNRRRERVVDENVMRRFASKLRPPTFEEGFSKITVVRLKRRA